MKKYCRRRVFAQKARRQQRTMSNRKGKANARTLMDMRTDLTAVPHAGLGYHFLRVHVRTPGAWRSSKGRVAQSVSRKRSDRLTSRRASVRVDDQSTPPSSYRSFVACGGYDEPYAPAKCETIQKNPCDYKGHTHTHTPPQREAN